MTTITLFSFLEEVNKTGAILFKMINHGRRNKIYQRSDFRFKLTTNHAGILKNSHGRLHISRLNRRVKLCLNRNLWFMKS